MASKLTGFRVAVLAMDGFEQVELTVPVRRLMKEGAIVKIVSLRKGRLRGVNFIWPGRKVKVDLTVSEASPTRFDGLLLPGGFVSPDLLRQSEEVLRFVRGFDERGLPIATLCHGPEVLVSAGLVRGRQLTSWKGIAEDVRNAGGSWVDEAAVLDGNLLSSRSPKDLRPFCKAMVALYVTHAPIAVIQAAQQQKRRRRLFGGIALAGSALFAARRLTTA